LDLAANKLIVMFVSPAILVEYEEVLRRPRLRLDSTRITRSLAVIRRTSRLVAGLCTKSDGLLSA
jgi:predicted nucleic acid-binding protein